MLQELRDKSQGWIAKVIIGVIILIFAMTGFEYIIGAISNTQDIATVNGQSIEVSNYKAVLERTRNKLKQQLGDAYDNSEQANKKLGQDVLNNLIDYKLLTQAAENIGFSYNFKDSILREIYTNPEFLDDNNRFSPDLWAQRVRDLGYNSEQQLIDDLLIQTLISQLQSGIAETAVVSNADINYLAKLIKQTRNYSYKLIKAKDITDITDKEISQWYEAHKDKLETKEQVIIEYVTLKKDSFLDKVKVSDDEVKNLYARKVVLASNLENRKRISHILIPITATETDVAAKAKIDEIATKLTENADFTLLAKEYSKDLATADKGGDLGFITADDAPDPAFDVALKDLAKVGDTTIVKSRFGWHILKLTDISKPKALELDVAMRNQLIDEIKQAKVNELYILEQRKLDAEAYESFDDLTQIAKDFGLTLEVSEPFSKQVPNSAITANSKVVSFVFTEQSLKNKENSTVINITPNTSVVVRVKEHLSPKPMTLEQARPEIIEQLQKDKVKIEGQQIITALKAGKVSPEGDTWTKVDSAISPLQVTLDQKTDTFTPVTYEILKAVFAAPKPTDKPSISGLSLKNGDYVVIYLTKVNEFSGQLSEADKEILRNVLTNSLVAGDWNEFHNYIKNTAEIKSYLDELTEN